MYCDTAILVKLLTPEPDSGEFEERLQNEPISSSELALGEVSSALFAKERHGLILPDERKAAWLQFETWVADKTIRLEPLNSNVLRRIPLALARCHPDAFSLPRDRIALGNDQIVQPALFCQATRSRSHVIAFLFLPLIAVFTRQKAG